MTNKDKHYQSNAPILLFNDIEVGDFLTIPSLLITAGHIDQFAALTGDEFDIHMSDEAATSHGFPSRVAHGLLILSLVDGLKNQASMKFNAIASLGWDWKFHQPVLIGDTIHPRLSIMNKRVTKKNDRGILYLEIVVTNQTCNIVQSGQNQLLVYR